MNNTYTIFNFNLTAYSLEGLQVTNFLTLDSFTLTNLHACIETPMLCITTSFGCIATACALTSSAVSAINDIFTNYSVCGSDFRDYTFITILTLSSSALDYLNYVKCEGSLKPLKTFNGNKNYPAHVNIVLVVDVNANGEQIIYLRDSNDFTCLRLKQLYPH